MNLVVDVSNSRYLKELSENKFNGENSGHDDYRFTF